VKWNKCSKEELLSFVISHHNGTKKFAFTKQFKRLVYIGVDFTAISPVTATRDSHYLLAFATLGEVTEMEMILIAKVSNEGDIMSRYRRCFHMQTLPI
jgi:hypothetical protein